MSTQQYTTGDTLEFTRDLEGVLTVKAGDRLQYLGNSQAVVLDGQGKDWLVTLTVSSPVRRICPNCGSTLGSRYHEVACEGSPTESIEDLEAAAAILDKVYRNG